MWSHFDHIAPEISLLTLRSPVLSNCRNLALLNGLGDERCQGADLAAGVVEIST